MGHLVGVKEEKNYKKVKTGVVTSICKSEFFNFFRLTLYINFRHRNCLPPSLSDVKGIGITFVSQNIAFMTKNFGTPYCTAYSIDKQMKQVSGIELLISRPSIT